MKITNAKYWKYPLTGKVTHIFCTIEGRELQQQVPIDNGNRDYQAIQEWVKIDGNSIEDAD